jgi:hypothetical protein
MDVKLQLALAGLGIALIAVSVQANGGDLPAAVEVKASTTRDAVPAVVTSRGLEGLSPGNRLIAQALYSAQKAGALSGRQPWSLERVATARTGGSNWGEVFQQMKQDGLVEAETLGQVVTWYQYHQVTPLRPTQDTAASVAGMTTPATTTK